MRGGAERIVLESKNMLESAGHKVAVFGMHHPENIIENKYFIPYIDYKNLGVIGKIRAGLKSIYNKEAKKQFEQLVDDFKPDLIHFHNIYHQLSFSLFDVVRKKNIKSVMTLHDYKMISPNYTLFHHGHIDDTSIGKKYYRCLFSNCMESWGRSFFSTIEAYLRHFKKWKDVIDVYIAPSQFMKDMCVEAGLSEKKIHVLQNPITIKKENIKQKEGNYVAYVGRLSKEKGVDILLKAAKETPDIPYKIIGDGPERKSLESYVKKCYIKNVHFYGWQTGSALDTFIAQARMIVIPSVWYEPFGLVVLEAQIKGKTVIGSDIGGIKELINKELLVEAGNSKALEKKIRIWYNNPSEKRQIMQKQIYKKIKEKYNIEKHRHALVSVYEKLCIKK